jgi:hypothetical protein
MAFDHLEVWHLRKHDSAEIFGPVRFEKIKEWAMAAQVNSQDMVSTDREVWTKAPMIPDLAMDWLIEVSDRLLYGPTTEGALMEFMRVGEITRDTMVVNCKTGETMPLGSTPFFREEAAEVPEENAPTPPKAGIRVNLQKRIRDLDLALADKTRQLALAQETITKLEAMVQDLQTRLADIRAGRR